MPAGAGAGCRLGDTFLTASLALVKEEPDGNIALIYDVEGIYHVVEAEGNGAVNEGIKAELALIVAAAGIEEAARGESTLFIIIFQVFGKASGKRYGKLFEGYESFLLRA